MGKKQSERVVLFIACPDLKPKQIDGRFAARACAALDEDERVTNEHLRELMLRFQPREAGEGLAPAGDGGPDAGRVTRPRIDLRRTLDENLRLIIEKRERALLEAYLRANEGRIAATAEQAGISRRTLLRKLSRYGIDKRRFIKS